MASQPDSPTSAAATLFAPSEAGASQPYSSGFETRSRSASPPASHDFRVDFDHGPGIELRPLTIPDVAAESISQTDKESVVSESTEKQPRWRRFLEEWGWETAACLLSLVGFFATVGLLMAYDGKAQPSWPYGITLNAAVAILSTMTKGLLLVPAAACISQSIWIGYAESAHPLRIVTTYDAASRGPLGAFRLIWRLRAQRIACLGAVLIILAVGIGPTVQQTIVVNTRLAPTTQFASLPRARSFVHEVYELTNSVWSELKSDIVPTGMIGLLYAGMYRSSAESDQAFIDVVPDCPTSDCTFPEFESLAVCSACVDYAREMERTCITETTSKPLGGPTNVTQCTFSLPNGLNINQTTMTDATLAVSALLDPVHVYGKDGSILHTTILNASTSSGSIYADAHKCSLSWCVKTYQAKVVNGTLVERETQSRAGWDWLYEDQARYFPADWAIDVSLQNGHNVSDFVVSRDASIKITNWLYYKFSFSNSKYLKIQREGSGDWFRFWEDKSGNFTEKDFQKSSHLRDTIKIMQRFGFEEVFSNVAKALTTYVRMDGSTDRREDLNTENLNMGPIAPVRGTAYISEVYIEVQWPWLIFLGSILVCTIMFLAWTIHKSSKYKIAAWKSEPLALMYHGLETIKEEHQLLDSVKDMHQQGKRTRVQLQETESGLRLGYADR